MSARATQRRQRAANSWWQAGAFRWSHWSGRPVWPCRISSSPASKPGGFGGEVIAGKPQEFKPGTVSLVQEGHFYISGAGRWRLSGAVVALHASGLHRAVGRRRKAIPLPVSRFALQPQRRSHRRPGAAPARSLSRSSWSTAISSSIPAIRSLARNSIRRRTFTSEAMTMRPKENYTRYVVTGLVLTLAILVSFQIYILREPQRIAAVSNEDKALAVGAGQALFQKNCVTVPWRLTAKVTSARRSTTRPSSRRRPTTRSSV